MIAKEVGIRAADFDGNAAAYLQAVYRGQHRGDPIMMDAAHRALGMSGGEGVTPDMHRVHHSLDYRETDSNFSFNLTWRDPLSGMTA